MADMVDYSTVSGSGVTNTLNNPQFRYMMSDSRWRMLYPAPYFDPIAMQTLMDPKILMHWGRYMYDWQPIFHAAINKMVSYPITEFIFDTDDATVENFYKNLFEKINVRSILVRMGLDYFVSGNAYFSMIMPFKRMLECPECNTAVAADSPNIEFKLRNNQLLYVCPKCNHEVAGKIKDTPISTPEDIKPILWDPLNMKVEYDEVLGTYEYFYALPGSVASSLDKAEKRSWSTYPMYMIKAARQKKLIRLFKGKVLHLRRDSHSSTYHKGYGQSIVSPVLKYIFHLLVLLRAQDAMAIDQILPWTIVSPSSNGSVDPSGELDLGQFRSNLEHEYKEWKSNPLRKSIMPIPVNAQIVGAQGKALMLTNEIQEVTNQILAGMGVPNEFVYGGLQWSGANVSLRMLENQFINYRNMMQQVIDYIIDQCHIYFNMPKIPVRMQSFKMADDVAQKDILMRMVEGGLISKHTMLKELFPNIDYDKEQDAIQKEQAEAQKAQIEQQMVAQNVQNMYGIPAQMPGMSGGDMGDQQHGDLPEQNPPRSEGDNAQV